MAQETPSDLCPARRIRVNQAGRVELDAQNRPRTKERLHIAVVCHVVYGQVEHVDREVPGLIETDQGIIDLRAQVKDAARAQLENGVITANDYLREVNAEDQARQLLITHQIQLLQAEINYHTILGKQ